MGVESLKQALDDCLINFDRRVLITDLLQDYQLPYAEVDNILLKYVAEQEKQGTKFEKRFLVCGEDAVKNKEIYTVVEDESKLQEWRRKLKNAETALYSLEVAGGAKAAANIFKPMKWCAVRLENVEARPALKWQTDTNQTNSSSSAKPVVKTETKMKGFDFGAKKTTSNVNNAKKSGEAENNTKKSPEIKKSSPENKKVKTEPKAEVTLEDKKQAVTTKVNNNNKKGIASFFTAGVSTSKTETKKANGGVTKQTSPKKMNDFFKKNDKLDNSISKAEKVQQVATKVNESMQLFDNDDEDDINDKKNCTDIESENSSQVVINVNTTDDEEELEVLRRQCSEKEESADLKRRRILDSDDEEPENKHEKVDKEDRNKQNIEESAGQSESYLDKDGFVITIKSKKPAVIKKPIKSKTPEKSPHKQENNKKATKATPKSTAKTKQGNIMSFFNKK